MTSQEAQRLARGQKVHGFNGPYCQRGIVVRMCKRTRGGYWVEYQWKNSRGVDTITTKRHQSVHLGWPDNSQDGDKWKPS